MEKKTNIYLCVTEYHVLLSILLSTEFYGSDEYLNKIILCNEGRFNDELRYNLSQLGNIRFDILKSEYVRSRCFLEIILQECNGCLFSYNLNNPHFFFVFYMLKKDRRAETAIVQEGLASYNHRDYTLRERISRMRVDFKILRKAGINNAGFYIYCYGIKGKWGRVFDYYDNAVESSIVDRFYLSHPEYAQYGVDKVCKIPLFSERSKSNANVFFKYSGDISLNENDIVFVDQRIDGSFDFVQELSETFVNSNIYVKLHPITKGSWASIYESIPRVHILKTMQGVPIELMLQNLHHNIVITPFSSALLLENKECRYYYAYKWFLNRGYNIENGDLYTPGNYIVNIDSVDQIKLF